MNIPISKTVFTRQDIEIISEPLKSGWVVQGKFVQEFENLWNDFTGSKYSVATTSCTTALHLSLFAIGIGPGDEVIVPSFTWVSTANAVETTGAKVIFCDIDIDTFNLNTKYLEKLISTKTKCIIPVHLFGLPADIEMINNISKGHNLIVIEDAACGFGAKLNGKHVGSFSNTACFSFHPRKAITTGEGGMIATNDNELAVKLRSIRDHGSEISDFERQNGKRPYLLPAFPNLGFNYRMTDIQASIGCSQMKRAIEILNSRKNIASKYDLLFRKIEWLKPQKLSDGLIHGYQSYVCLFKPENITLNNLDKINKLRNDFMDYLQENGISTRPGTHAVHALDYYRNKYYIKPEDYPYSWIADKASIAFPLYPTLTEEEFEYISSKILAYKHK
jgi:perosamine synthetase